MSTPWFFSAADEKNTDAPGASNSIRCELCHRRCLIAPGKYGTCKVRFNREGKPKLPFYGYITACCVDPIEKKPLYHFRPGSEILSVGFAGCNLHCPFCQNWKISQSITIPEYGFSEATLPDQKETFFQDNQPEFFPPGRFYSAADLVNEAKQTGGLHSVAYTYSEPLIHIEFLLDAMKEAKKAGVANVLVSNGNINLGAADEILQYTDAANIDLKCFSKETYENVLGGNLETVCDFIRKALEKGVHLELTTLVIPGLNDSPAELDKCGDFIAELESSGLTIPWHLSAYHPDWKWRTPLSTEPRSLINAAARAGEKVKFVYVGNIVTAGKTADRDATIPKKEKNFSDTYCPHCGETLVSRRFYNITASLKSNKEENGKTFYSCAFCGNTVPIL